MIEFDSNDTWSHKMAKYGVKNVFLGKFAKIKVKTLDKSFKKSVFFIQTECDRDGVNFGAYYHLYKDGGIGDGISAIIIDARTGIAYSLPKNVSVEYSKQNRFLRTYPQNTDGSTSTTPQDYVWIEEAKEFIHEAEAK